MGAGADSPVEFDVVLVGGGVIGCGTARALILRAPSLKICVLEKEPELAMHQSGRNSGVIHAGYNQKPGTLKARFVVEGSRRLREFCRERRVYMNEDGILVLARNPAEEATLDVLRERGEANGADVRLIGPSAIADREPEASGIAALLAPGGASFDSRAYVVSLAAEARRAGIQFRTECPVTNADELGGRVHVDTSAGGMSARLLVNCGGLHADRIARSFGVGLDLKIVPFLGYYSELRPERRGLVRSHLYPCPDLGFPFLGVHLSRTFDGRVLVGPGSSLALGREAYTSSKANARDMLETFTWAGFWRLLAKRQFRLLVTQEWRKSVSRDAVAEEARQLVPAIRSDDLVPGRAGIRAQLVDLDGNLVDDLRVDQTYRSIHVMNAVSPALTCSLPFADYLADMALSKL